MGKKAKIKSRAISKSKKLGRENKKKAEKRAFFVLFFHILQHTGVQNPHGLMGHPLYHIYTYV